MGVARKVEILLDSGEVTDSVTGSVYNIVPQDQDQTADHEMSVGVYLHTTQSGGATSPTTDLVVESSGDGTLWVPVASATQLAADGAKNELDEVALIGPFIRVRLVLGGGTKPTATGKAMLACAGLFSLRKVG